MDRMKRRCLPLLPCLVFAVAVAAPAFADELKLQGLLEEALKNSPEILAAEARTAAARFRVPQARSLPDPMFMVGYQNDGFEKYSYGDALMSMWMFSATQMFPFPGKLPIRGEIAARGAEGAAEMQTATRLKVVARVKELYYDLFFAHKTVEILGDKDALFSRIEEAALARYAAGTGMQQEVLMAQTEKYMILERQEMARQQIQSSEAMLNAAVGRDVNAAVGRPSAPPPDSYDRKLEDLIAAAYERSPEIRARQRMAAASEWGVRLARKDYYPDFSITAEYDRRGGSFMDMWSVKTAVSIPLYYRAKQRQAVSESEAMLTEARRSVEAARLMTASVIRDNYAMLRTSERLQDLYRNGLIPKAYQDFDASLAGYATGKVDALTVISRLKSVVEFELQYWRQVAEREKALARIDAAVGETGHTPEVTTP